MDFRGKNIDLVGKLWLWFGISLAVITIGVVSWAAFGLNLGIDFKGGGQLQYRIPVAQRPAAGQDVALLNSVRQQLEKQGVKNPTLQIAGGDTLVVQTNARDGNELDGQVRNITQALATQWKINTAANPDALEPLSRELVGPVIGKELRNKRHQRRGFWRAVHCAVDLHSLQLCWRWFALRRRGYCGLVARRSGIDWPVRFDW